MVLYGLLLLLSLYKIVVGNDIDLPLNPVKRCVPTSTQMGICHVCVCKTDGMYHCRESVCSLRRNDTDPTKKECDPLHMYRYNTVFCSCDASGYWRSLECKQRYNQIIPKDNPYTVQIGTNIACIPGHFYITDCNICTCEANGYINFQSCTNRRCLQKSKFDICNPGDILRTPKELCECSDINYFIDRLCLKVEDKAVQEVKADDIDRIIDFGTFWENIKSKCKPLNTYKLDCSQCYCNDNGNKINCNIKECKESLQTGNKKSALRQNGMKYFESMPELKSQYEKSNLTSQQRSSLPKIGEGELCVPGKLYKVDCNTCKCTEGRTLMCTKMACIGWKNYKKMHQAKKVLRIGGAKLKNFLPNVPKGVPCKPGKFYKSKCKRCFCSEDNKIECSKKENGACSADRHGNPLSVRSPEDVHPMLQTKQLQDLSTLSSASEMCDPGKSYKVDCNFCLCLEDKNLFCQKKMCYSFDDMIKMEAKEMSGKPCTVGETTTNNCKSCNCLDGKTDCHVIPHCSPSNKLRLAGKIEQPPEDLDPANKNVKCIPSSIYKVDCNKCYCQVDGSLRCTQKTCLNFSQVQLLKQQREYLEKHGL